MTEMALPYEGESVETKERTSKMVLYIGIFSIVMLFAGLSSAYVISSYGELWINLSLPKGFFISTGIILLSSLTIKLAVNASNKGNESGASLLLGVTLLLGLLFGYFQYQGWEELVEKGSFVSGHVDNLNGVYGKDYTITYKGQELIFHEGNYFYPNDELYEKPLLDEIAISSNSSSSYFYILSFLHLVHVLGGILFLIAIFFIGKLSKSGKINNLRLRLGATYWHFVDGLWVYLFLFLLFIH